MFMFTRARMWGTLDSGQCNVRVTRRGAENQRGAEQSHAGAVSSHRPGGGMRLTLPGRPARDGAHNDLARHLPPAPGLQPSLLPPLPPRKMQTPSPPGWRLCAPLPLAGQPHLPSSLLAAPPCQRRAPPVVYGTQGKPHSWGAMRSWGKE